MDDSDVDRLRARIDALVPIVIAKTDMAKWPGALIDPRKMTPRQRGDFVWCGKVAREALGVATRIIALVAYIEDSRIARRQGTEFDDNMKERIGNAETEYQRIVKRMQDETV